MTVFSDYNDTASGKINKVTFERVFVESCG